MPPATVQSANEHLLGTRSRDDEPGNANVVPSLHLQPRRDVLRSHGWRTGAFDDRQSGVGGHRRQNIDETTGPCDPDRGCIRRANAEMHRTIPLRPPLATTAAIIVPESNCFVVNYSHAGSDSVQVGLDTLEVKLDEVVTVAVVLEEIVQALKGIAGLQVRPNAVFHHQVEKPVVIVVAPGGKLVRRGDKSIFERHAFLSA